MTQTLTEPWAGITEALTALKAFGESHPGRTITMEWYTTEQLWYVSLGKGYDGYAFATEPALTIHNALACERDIRQDDSTLMESDNNE